jgi:hypothetical protein
MAVPGPGQYENPFTINKDGKYFHAKYKTSCVGDFGKTMGRCKTAVSFVPGPGSYDVSANQDISASGKYCLSKTSNCPSRTFSSCARKDLNDDPRTPGPGNYKLPSEFGYYASKK